MTRPRSSKLFEVVSNEVASPMILVEVIAAIRDEEESLVRFVQSVRALGLPEGVELCLTFVEDSSRDGSLEVLRDLSTRYPEVAYYSLERGFGQGPAIVFGMSRRRGDVTILMDADGSHPPEVIPRMIELHLEGAAVVQCIRRELLDRPVYREWGAAAFQTLAGWLVQVDLAEQSIYYRLVSAAYADQLVSEPRYWRFLRFPLPRASGELALLEIDTRERERGESKYGPMRLARLAIDAVLSLMSPFRARIGLLALGLLGLVSVVAGAWPVLLLLVPIAIWLVHRYRELRSGHLLKLMKVRESANVDAE